jgi:hypothetical protein
MKRLLFSFIIIGIVAITALKFSGAFFSDTETSVGNVLAAGSLDLKIDNTSYYNGATSSATSWDLRDLNVEKFFNFTDVKPGDHGEDTISVHVNTNDSWLCANLKLTSNDENGITGPESIAGDVTDGTGSGELAGRINFIWWADDGDNVLETGETILPGGPLGALSVGQTANVRLADSTGSIWGTGPLPGNTTKYIGKAWCFGNLTTDPLPQDNLGPTSPRTPANSTGGVHCDGSGEDNKTQTDSLTADISFDAIQSRNNKDFVCGGGRVTPTPTVTPTITPTPTPDPFADAVINVTGTFGHCCDDSNLSSSAVLAATLVTGPPDSPPASNFIQISDNSSVTLKFVDNKAVDGPGADVRIHTYDALFPADALIELSPDCINYTSFGIHSDTSNVDLDLSDHGLSQAECIRITDQVAGGDPFPLLGFDLDAAEALNNAAP